MYRKQTVTHSLAAGAETGPAPRSGTTPGRSSAELQQQLRRVSTSKNPAVLSIPTPDYARCTLDRHTTMLHQPGRPAHRTQQPTHALRLGPDMSLPQNGQSRKQNKMPVLSQVTSWLPALLLNTTKAAAVKHGATWLLCARTTHRMRIPVIHKVEQFLQYPWCGSTHGRVCQQWHPIPRMTAHALQQRIAPASTYTANTPNQNLISHACCKATCAQTEPHITHSVLQSNTRSHQATCLDTNNCPRPSQCVSQQQAIDWQTFVTAICPRKGAVVPVVTTATRQPVCKPPTQNNACCKGRASAPSAASGKRCSPVSAVQGKMCFPVYSTNQTIRL